MIVKLARDHHLKQSPTCGEIREILTGADYPHLTIAVAQDIRPTKAHFHRGFEEIYFVLDGTLQLKFFDPASDRTWTQELAANEMCVIPQGVHHAITQASATNRLCAICVPGFDAQDEHLSDRI